MSKPLDHPPTPPVGLDRAPNIVRFVIEGDLATGNVQVNGPLHDARVWQWLLGEARRCCERIALARELGIEQKPQTGLVIAKLVPNGDFKA